jgi:hypothetical protein
MVWICHDVRNESRPSGPFASARDAVHGEHRLLARLAVLDEEIAGLKHAREYLRGALLCRYDHPVSECAIMGAEIDRRLQPYAS